MGAAAILAQDPHSKPFTTKRSPAPFVHVSDDSTELEFRIRYRAFVDAFRAGAQRLRERAHEIREMFPLLAFPPALPFNAPDRPGPVSTVVIGPMAEWPRERSARRVPPTGDSLFRRLALGSGQPETARFHDETAVFPFSFVCNRSFAGDLGRRSFSFQERAGTTPAHHPGSPMLTATCQDNMAATLTRTVVPNRSRSSRPILICA